MGKFDNHMNRLGLKNIDEIWAELRELSLHMPIIHQGFRLQKEFEADISNEYLLAALSLVLAKHLQKTQNELLKFTQMKCPDDIILKT